MITALDASAAALAELVQRERQLVGDVSHQLRSRLTALQLGLDELTPIPAPAPRPSRRWSRPWKLAAVLDEPLEAPNRWTCARGSTRCSGSGARPGMPRAGS